MELATVQEGVISQRRDQRMVPHHHKADTRMELDWMEDIERFSERMLEVWKSETSIVVDGVMELVSNILPSPQSECMTPRMKAALNLHH